jgi:hypothetical protein
MMIVREDKINLVLVMQLMVDFLVKGLVVGARTIWAIVAMVWEAVEIFSGAEEVIGILQILIMGQWIVEIANREVEEVKDMVEAMEVGQDF